MAMLDADLRVRTPDSASTKAINGASSIRGTAHGRVLDGSNEKPRDPGAAPDAARTMLAAARSTFSESPRGPQARRPGRPRPTRPPRAGSRPLDRAPAGPKQSRTARRR